MLRQMTAGLWWGNPLCGFWIDAAAFCCCESCWIMLPISASSSLSLSVQVVSCPSQVILLPSCPLFLSSWLVEWELCNGLRRTLALDHHWLRPLGWSNFGVIFCINVRHFRFRRVWCGLLGKCRLHLQLDCATAFFSDDALPEEAKVRI